MRIKFDKGFWLSLATALALGIGWSFDKAVSAFYILPFYAFISFFIPGVVNLLIPRVKLKSLVTEIKNTNIRNVFILAFANATGFLLYIKALTMGEVSKVVLVTTSAAVITVVLAIFLLNEKDKVTQKIIAAFLVVGATILLAI